MSWVEKASASQKWPGLDELVKAENTSTEKILSGIAKGRIVYVQNAKTPPPAKKG